MADILYIGDPLLDITATCKNKDVEAFGLRLDDWVKADERHKKLFDHLLKSPFSTFVAGGSSQNSARISKWILGKNGNVYFSGCVGRDLYAGKMRKELEKSCVKPLYIEHDNLQTGLCACLTGCDGERSMCSNLYAASCYDVSHLHSIDVQKAMKDADAIFMACYFVVHSPEVSKLVAHFCHKNRKIFALTLSAAHICESYTENVLYYVRYADLVFGNYKEASTLMAAITGEKNAPIEECTKWLAEFPRPDPESSRIVVISNGSSPVVSCESKGQPVSHAVPAVKSIVDTIGCGDGLASGFLATYLCSKSIDQAAQVGIKVASLLTQTKGCTIPDVAPPSF